MRPIRPWRLEPTLRYLALLPLAVALSGLGLECAIQAMNGSGSAAQRPGWLLAAGTGLAHALALALLPMLLRAHAMGWRDAFGFLGRDSVRQGLRTLLWTGPAVMVAWLLHQASGWVLEQVSIPHDSQPAVDAVRATVHGWERGLLLFFAACSAPLVEEILFRGILWPLARDHGWRKAGAVVVSGLFALIHLNLAAFLPLFALGLFWIWLYESTGDLAMPVLSHGLFNAFNFVWILWLPTPAAP